MRYLILVTLLAAVSARPDIGLQLRQKGYNYPQPGSTGGNGGFDRTTSTGNGGNFGGASSGSFGGENSVAGSNGNGGSFGSNGNGGGSFGSNGNGESFGSNGNAGSFGSNGNGGSFGSNGNGGSFGSNGNGGSFNGGNSGANIGGDGSDLGSSGPGADGNGFGANGNGFGGNSYNGEGDGSSGDDVTQAHLEIIDIRGPSGDNSFTKSVIKQGEPQITKHFYIHEAPEEARNAPIHEKEIVVKPQIHHKIIFIKAPSDESEFGGSNVPIFPQNEEKTIVYVLSKKSDDLTENGEFPTPPPTVTSKPEVFFVKYKTKEEADQAVSKIQESYQEGGPGFNAPASFAESLGASSAGVSAKSFSNGGSSGNGNGVNRAPGNGNLGSNGFENQPRFGLTDTSSMLVGTSNGQITFQSGGGILSETARH